MKNYNHNLIINNLTQYFMVEIMETYNIIAKDFMKYIKAYYLEIQSDESSFSNKRLFKINTTRIEKSLLNENVSF